MAEYPQNTNIVSPICATEEYAIKTLMSKDRNLRTHLNTKPNSTQENKKTLNFALSSTPLKRNKPNVPIFKRIAASAILPTVGASTWALGNHK